MQPTVPQSTGGADMDLPAVQSMDWLFKKEKIFLLAQFWQQRATLAEKEVNSLKEQLSTTQMDTSLGTTTPIASSTIIEQNGVSPPSPSTTPVSESSVTINLNNKLENNTDKLSDNNDSKLEHKLDVIKEAKSLNNNNNISNNNNNTSNSNRTTPTLDKNSENSVNNNCSSNNNNNSSTRTLTDELAAKDKEISALFEEVNRLRNAIANIQESHNLQIQRLEDRLEEKRQHIVRLESRIEKSTDYDDIKKENSILRSVDLSTSQESKQFQELLLERTKALAAHTEAIKSSNSDGSPSTIATPLNQNPSSSSPCTPNHNNNSNNDSNRPASTPNNTLNNHSFLPPPLQNVEQFGSFLGEEIVSNWRRGLELPPPPPGLATAVRNPLLMNHHVNSPSTDLHLNNNHQEDKSSHHETSSTASTPVLQESRHEDSLHGGGMTPHSTSISKSPLEDNNNTLGLLQHSTANLIQGHPFQFQERGHFRFAEDLQLPPGSMVGRLGDSLIPKGDPMEAKLQEMLRYNMDKYANQNLDTLHISRRVRELLSVHNIGQRLFAKYVLGLSQGTVSELLSKPKPWDKLTEKGRDSYRKMHAWACDDNAILLLKSLIPKKEPGMPQYGRPDGEMNEDRIQHILTEASSMIQKGTPTPQQQQHMAQQLQLQQQQLQQLHLNNLDDSQQSDNDSKSPNSRDVHSPFSKDYLSRRLKKYECDDIPQEKISKIYQEEFAKLIRSPRDAFPSLLFPHFLSGGMPPMDRLQDDNIRMALEAYHRELAKLQQSGGNMSNFPNLPNLPNFLALQQQALNGAQDLSLPKEKMMKMNGSMSESESEMENNKEVDDAMKHSAFSLVKPKQEPGMSTPTTTASSAPSPLGNNILPPAITPTEEFSVSASPLQRMASITNSLITQPPVTPHHSSSQRPLKAILPPITQQQFDLYNNLNTEDIVRRVKEALSQYSISQRLFGESVLGLSQGSVSDLLARPKPWHMLTQKGREPFIRMKMFLEDENAVHKLVASQYKIAPEKLMRTGSYTGSPQIPAALSKQMPQMPKMLSDSITKMQQDQHKSLLQLQISQMQQHMPPTSQTQQLQQQAQQQMQAQQQLHHQQQQQQQQHREAQQQRQEQQRQEQTMLLTPPGMPPQHAIAINTSHDKKPMIMPVHSPQQPSNAMRGMNQHISPTVYEMAALTQDLDTQIITTKIKEALLANNIGQKIFGEAVLGLSQGSVSELLSKPKPWHMLSIKGREPFIRMQLWLSDANNVDRLQALKNERREASKRRRSTGPGAQDNSSDTSSNDTSEFYHSNSPGPGSVGSASAPPNKKQRVLFSEEQKEALRLAFALDPYPNVQTIEFLANELGLSTRTITNWFHNHRMRLKQQVPHGAPSEPIPSRENQTGAPFDPVQFRILLNQRLMDIQKERMGLSGVPLPYPPYFAANPNLAALIGRGLIPGDVDMAAFSNAVKEQMSGLDLSMPASLKREGDDDYDDDNDLDSHMSDNESVDGRDKRDHDDEIKDDHSSSLTAALQALSRTNRRKPAAPQWVNPDWQDDNKKNNIPPGSKKDDEIINGVCVMQQSEQVRLDPTTVQERFAAAMAAAAAAAVAAATSASANEDNQSDNENDDLESNHSKQSSQSKNFNESNQNDDEDDDKRNNDDKSETPTVKKEIEDDSDRWEY